MLRVKLRDFITQLKDQPTLRPPLDDEMSLQLKPLHPHVKFKAVKELFREIFPTDSIKVLEVEAQMELLRRVLGGAKRSEKSRPTTITTTATSTTTESKGSLLAQEKGHIVIVHYSIPQLLFELWRALDAELHSPYFDSSSSSFQIMVFCESKLMAEALARFYSELGIRGTCDLKTVDLRFSAGFSIFC